MSDRILASTAARYGLTPNEANRILGWGRIVKIRRLVLELGMVTNGHAAREVAPVPRATHSWCVQCERRVHVNEARQCRSQWCKGR